MRTTLTTVATVLLTTLLGACLSAGSGDAIAGGSVRPSGGADAGPSDCTAAARALGACSPQTADDGGTSAPPAAKAPEAPCDAAEKAFRAAKDLDQKNQLFGCGGGHDRHDVLVQIGLAIALCPSYTAKFRADPVGFAFSSADTTLHWDMVSALWTWGDVVVRDASGTAVWTGLEHALVDTRLYTTSPLSGAVTAVGFGSNGQFSWITDAPDWTYGQWSLGATRSDGSIGVVVTPLAGGATKHYTLTQDTAKVDGKTIPIPSFSLVDDVTHASFATQVGCVRDGT